MRRWSRRRRTDRIRARGPRSAETAPDGEGLLREASAEEGTFLRFSRASMHARAEPVEPRRIVGQDQPSAPLVRRPVEETVEEQRLVRPGVPARMGPVAGPEPPPRARGA